MWREAAEASAVVRRQRGGESSARRLGERLRRLGPRVVLTVARGSSDHAATFAKYLVETRLGIPVASAAPSVASLYGAHACLERTVCLTISQSGASPDLVRAAEVAKAGGAIVVALVNDVASPLADVADDILPLHAGEETSVAATKSYIASLAAILALVAAWSGDAELEDALEQLPDLLDQAWGLDWSVIPERLRDTSSLFVLGRGLGLGIAQEAALKLKETSRLHAEAFSTAEVRHGPMALVGPRFPALVFRQEDETADGVDTAIADLLGKGASLLVAGPAPNGAVRLPVVPSPSVIAPILQIHAFYRAANALAFARGIDPDNPPHLAKVTETL